MKKIPVWIDTDTGVDDSVALLIACKLEEIELVGVSAVMGNVSLDDTFRNARDVLYLAGRQDIKVYAGANLPLIKEHTAAAHVHGNNGLGGAVIETSTAQIETKNAYDALYEKARELNGELVVCAVGPLTNIAITIAKYPDFIDYVKQLNVMGGAGNGGNVTPCAEFNIYADPEAAECVFKSGININMFGLDVTMKAYLDENDIEEINSYGNKASNLFKDSTRLIYQHRKKFYDIGLCEHDSCPVIYIVHPEWFEGHKCGVYVETLSKLTQGKTVTDLWSDYKFEKQNCTLFTDVNQKEFSKLIKDIYKSY